VGLSVEDLLGYMTPEPAARPLPSKARRNHRMAEILHEHYVLGASPEQIAERRHVTPSTVRTALRQGMHVLRHSAERGARVPSELLR
jgi:DNA-binding CsgD family transcriptional regulator